MPFLKTDTGTTFYQVFSEDSALPWVTLINGYTRTSRDFNIFVKKLQTRNFNVITLDNRGSGQSNTYDDFEFSDFKNDIIEIWDTISIKDSHVIGISMGGAIAQLLSSDYQDRVGKLILISTFLEPISLEWQPWGNSLPVIIKQLGPYFSDSFQDKNKVLIRAMAAQILKSNQEGNFNRGANLQKQAMKSFFSKNFKQNIKSKTLIYHGEDDKIIPITEAEKIQSVIPNSRLKKEPGKGHLLLAEVPQLLYETSIEFLLER